MFETRSQTFAFLALVSGAIAMGFSPIFVRLADVGPFASAFWRVALALPPLWAWQVLAGEPPARGGRDYLATLVLSGLFFAGDLIFWHLSILHTTVANATLLATMAPVWVFIVSALVFGHRLRRAELGGLGVCIIGGAFLIRDTLGIAPERLVGDLEALATSLFFGLYILAITRARRFAGPAQITFYSTAVTAACLLVAALVVEGDILPRSAAGWAVLAGLAFISQAAGQGLLAFALGRLPVAFSSLVVFLEAVAAALLAWVLFGEALGPWQWLGGFFVLFGIWLARPRTPGEASGRNG